jgi:two-component system, NarL family, sensor kinase
MSLLSRKRTGEGRSGDSPSSPSSVAKFAVGGLAALALVGVGSFLIMRNIGRTEAIGNAEDLTRIAGRQIVEPRISDGIFRATPASIRRLDRVVNRDVLQHQIVRVKIWTGNGRIVYSDKHRLIGARYELDSDDLQALHTSGVASNVSDLSRPENRFERSKGDLMEVYMGIHAPNGRPLLFETYQPLSSIAAGGSSIWKAFAPVLVGALLILAVVQVPLAASMARRLRRSHAEREALLKRAIDASDRERRRIAGDLHDGVVQSLAGTAFSLAAAAERSNGGNGGSAREILERGATQTRRSVRELRSLLVEIYPPSLREAGLESALMDLLAPLGERGIETEMDIDLAPAIPGETEAVLYRVAQEAVRNAVTHAQPSRITVAVGRVEDHPFLTVTDDGRGFPTEGTEPQSASGHFGIQLMRDLAADAGGELWIEPGPEGGTRVRLEVPAR